MQTANFINTTLYVHKIDFHHAYIDLSGYKEILQSLFDFQHDLKTTRRVLFKSSVTFKSIAWIMDLAEIGRQRQIFVYTSFFNPLISFWSRKILNTRNMKIGPLKFTKFCLQMEIVNCFLACGNVLFLSLVQPKSSSYNDLVKVRKFEFFFK